LKKKFKRILYLITFFAVLIIISRAVNIYSIKSWEKQQKYGKDGILVGAESYHFDRGGDNIVMLHSLGGSPAEFKDIVIYLAGKNYNVDALLLPGHGTTPEDLAKVGYEEWISEVDHLLSMLDKDKTIISGTSTGSILALYFAQKYNLKGVILLNSPLELQSAYIKFISLIKLFTPYNVINSDEYLEIKKERVSYNALPYSSVEELLELTSEIKLQEIDEPILILQSQKDELVKVESAEVIFNNVNSQRKYVVYLSNSTHGVLTSDDKKLAVKVMEGFLQEL